MHTLPYVNYSMKMVNEMNLILWVNSMNYTQYVLYAQVHFCYILTLVNGAISIAIILFDHLVIFPLNILFIWV